MERFAEALAALERMLADGNQDQPVGPAIAAAVDALEATGGLDLERAVAILAAGARLLERRARELLPPEPGGSRPGPGDEAEAEPETAEELARRLSEYRSFKEAAALLRRFEELQSARFPSGGVEVPSAGSGLEGLTLEHLVAAFQRVWEQARPEPPAAIAPEQVTVEACMEAVLGRLAREGEQEFSALFEGRATRRQVVVTFLALLELIRLGRVRVRQERPFAPIFVSLAGET